VSVTPPVDGPRFDLPLIEAESEEFWSALRDGRLLLKLCSSCGRHHYYPRPFCPHCWSGDVDWVEASGGATLYTHSTVYVNDLPPFALQVPYLAAVVDLDEGPRMMTRVVDCEPDDLRIGMRLRMRTQAVTAEVTMAVFAPE
jgi:hypothetical protein